MTARCGDRRTDGTTLAGAGWVAVLDEAGDVVVAVCFDTRIRP